MIYKSNGQYNYLRMPVSLNDDLCFLLARHSDLQLLFILPVGDLTWINLKLEVEAAVSLFAALVMCQRVKTISLLFAYSFKGYVLSFDFIVLRYGLTDGVLVEGTAYAADHQ